MMIDVDRKKLYAVSVSYLCVLLLLCFLPDAVLGSMALAAVSVALCVAACLLVKKRSILSLVRRQVALVAFASAALAITLYFLTGLHFGFYKTFVNASYIWKFVLPYAVVIVSSEILRSIFLMQKSKAVNVLTYVSFLVLDFLMLSGNNLFHSYNQFMDVIGMVIFPALTANVLYVYMSKKHGSLPCIAYKLPMTLYPYIIPYESQMSDSLTSFLKVLLPLLVLFFISALYERRGFVVSRKVTAVQNVITVALVALMLGVVLLISCQFKHGLLVVATGSMAGELNVGDAIIYEQYDDQPIVNGQVIVFKQDKSTIIHRVVKIEHINGEVRYYTQGDANEDADSGYITRADIIGVINLKIKYIGMPTIWIRSLFDT